jgi:Fe2+ transport system protein FeoA
MANKHGPTGIETDEAEAFLILLRSLGRQKAKGGYRVASVYAAEHVELWWGEIDALAKRLLELGRVEGSEVKRIIETARGSKAERV